MKVAFGETPDEFSQLILWPIYLELIGFNFILQTQDEINIAEYWMFTRHAFSIFLSFAYGQSL